MPFGKYKDFNACVLDHKDKKNPEAYCAKMHKEMTGEWPGHKNKAEWEVLMLQEEGGLQVNSNTGASYTVREADLEGRPHIVVPVIMLTEGVHCGSAGCFKYGLDLLKQNPSGWNGMPVPIGHPGDVDGRAVSCSSPDVLNQYNVGRLFNVHVQGNKLRGELWIDKVRLQNMDPKLMARINRHEVIEVSTGLIPQELGVGGVWNGDEYVAEVLSMRPDHLAILTSGTGACAVKDGCGIRNEANKEGNYEMSKAKIIEIWDGIFAGQPKVATNQETSLLELIQKVQTFFNAMDTDTKVFYLKELYSNSVVYAVRPGQMAQPGTAEHMYQADFSVNDKGEIALGDSVEVIKQVSYIPVSNEDTCECPNNNSKKGEAKLEKKDIVNKLIACNHTQWEEKDREVLMGMEEAVLNKMSMKVQDPPKPEEKPVTNDTPAEKVPEPKKEPEKPVANKAEDFIASAPPEVQEMLRSGLKLQAEKRTTMIQTITNTKGNKFTADQLKGMPTDHLEGIVHLLKEATPAPEQLPMARNFAGAAGVLPPVGNKEPVTNEDDKPLRAPTMADIFPIKVAK